MIRPTDPSPADPLRDSATLHDESPASPRAPMIETLGVMPGRMSAESARFRADTDQAGQWHVWERIGGGGWAVVRPCDCRLSARRLAEEWNKVGRSA